MCKYKFWYSAKQDDMIQNIHGSKKNFLLIGGKEIQYTEMTSQGLENLTSNWDDYILVHQSSYMPPIKVYNK